VGVGFSPLEIFDPTYGSPEIMSQPLEPDEVILPSSQRPPIKAPGDTANERDATAKIVARWLDELLQIPGTKFKIGLDPLIAFIPGIGDFLSSSVSAVVILESVRKGVAFSVIFRMGLNMVINALFDAIPGVGPFFSAFFKSNSRNLMLLQRWQEGEHQAVRRSSRIVLLCVVVLFSLCVALAILVWSAYMWALMKLFSFKLV